MPTIAISVFGASLGLTGNVGSLTFCDESPEKFLMAIISESRSGISPGRFTEFGASPIMVNIEFISSCGMLPAGNPCIQARASVTLPNSDSPSCTLALFS